MKVLLDENIDVRFKKEFKASGHLVLTVRDAGWNGVKNGQLLNLMMDNSFDVLIAVDKNLPYQQNLQQLPISIFVLDVPKNTLDTIKPFVAQILSLLDGELEKKVYFLSNPE